MALLVGDHALLVAAARPVCSKYGLAITGGYAMKAHGLVDRPSDDIDFATRSAAPIEEIAEALAAAYRKAGSPVTVPNTGGRFGHLDVTLPSGAVCRVDILKEPLNHEPAIMSFGPGQSGEVRAWAVAWSARLSMEIAEDEPWSKEEWTDE
jgi:hypothetical protein